MEEGKTPLGSLSSEQVVIPILFETPDHIPNDASIHAEYFRDLFRGASLPNQFDQAVPVHNMLRNGHVHTFRLW